MCDVCGKYIMPINPNELVNTFSVAQIPGKELHCDNKCKQAIQDCGGDWQKLPDGPLRKAYEEAQGGAKSKRVLTAAQAKAMVAAREKKRRKTKRALRRSQPPFQATR